MNWECGETERSLFERELEGYVPRRVFDSHAHLYEVAQFQRAVPGVVESGPAVAGLDAYREYMAQVMPGRELHGFYFGFPADGMDMEAGNRFLAAEVARDPMSRGAMMVRPDMNAESVRGEVRRERFAGLKCYHVYSSETPTFMSTIGGYLPEAQVRIAHEEGLAIVLHMVRPRALADPSNLATIRRYAERYPNARLILAHAARGFNPYHTIEAIGALSGLRNVWCDTAAVTECGAVEAIVRSLGVNRVLYGSDFPVTHERGRCVAIADSFLWLSPENTRFEAPYGDLRPTLVGIEALRALRLSCLNLGLGRSEVEAIFWGNAAALFGLV
jgi:predicted TIM-barrel fold metal-dependent hydrolase